jgi:hypothetical protein
VQQEAEAIINREEVVVADIEIMSSNKINQ